MKEFIQSNPWLALWLGLFIAGSLVGGIYTGWLKARKIQPNGFKWKQFRFEAIVTVVSLMVAGPIIGWATIKLRTAGIITFHHEPAAWWVILLEYALYFFAFDTWFYWLHHKSTSPNVLTTTSVNPLESFVNGGFVPLFTAAFTVHDQTMALIAPTNIIMGLYVHLGYEFLPRWWNRTWLTKWFITSTFHDQHHRYFTGNFGGYTTIWDRVCGTMRPKYEADFLKIKDRSRKAVAAEPAAVPAE